jgi:hypothetical protein
VNRDRRWRVTLVTLARGGTLGRRRPGLRHVMCACARCITEEAYSVTGCGSGNSAQCYTSLAGISYPINS